MPSLTDTTSSTEKLISACGGALLTSLVVTPMDVVKMRLQTQHVYTPSSPASTCCNTFKSCSQAIKHDLQLNRLIRGGQFANSIFCPIYVDNIATAASRSVILKGTFDGIYKILKYEGVSALWKGLSPAIVMSVPANVVYFVGYEYLKDFIQPITNLANTKMDYSPIFSGAIARTVAVTIISPIELFRTRLQAAGKGHDFNCVLRGVKNMVVQDGLTALWRGLPPTLWRDVPFSAIYWMGYEEIKKIIGNKYPKHELQTSFFAGALSGMFAATLTTPFDVAKTRRQVDAGRDVPLLKDNRVPAILKQIYKQDGFSGLFRGLTPRIAKIAPSCAIMISSYEMGKIFFAKQHQE
ncbi:mitochondrial carrier domain-containing protein [Mycotypha africana]|uniref:mitochondrial carrier domain-containing protein n=1 Tax=Mycotypha africana TaxID=64632 RepID=UPI0023019600|nr:mitochondrial carrier domain-containing protein [Mycotypha africana]KAI8967601.1 mitochondrial carrier domain-containing protein [Mycotypha africana]